MSCTAKRSLSLFDTEVHIFGYDCTAAWVFPFLIIFTILLKIYQNYVWGQLGQAQRVALQHSKRERLPYVWDIVRKEALSTSLGLISIILVLGFNVWVMIAIVIGNLVGVYRTYTKLTKDSHSTAHDLVEMLEKHRSTPNPNTAKFLSLMNEMIGQKQNTWTQSEWAPKSDMVF